ncbi:TKL protein kinase [Phytophthora cinnamomi]|uniref:TKL protein kinase n=1 Tax=Phytophthora cinnamomi TaxID=4785 RepID=UPI0035594EFB|nr:TKL protein kinase [Phytophthora cinnamomi]
MDLVRAAATGNVKELQAALIAGKDVEYKDEDGWTALMKAAKVGNEESVHLLLARGVGVNSQSKRGQSALAIAAEQGHVGVMKLLLDAGAAAELADDIGEVPLMVAAKRSQTESMRLLLERGVDINRQAANGDTALLLAAAWCKPEAVSLLLENKADTTLAKPDNHTALMLQRIQIQANEQPEIVPPNAQADLASIRARFHHFLVKYKQRNPFERLVSTRMVISLLKEFHERLDAVVAEVSEGDNNLSKWMESWDRDTQEVEASLVRLWKTNPMRILDSLSSQKSQEDALVLLGSETTRKRDSYTADSKTMLRSVKQSIIRLSGASVQAVPDWFLAEYEVQREEQHFALGSFGKVYHGTWYREKVVVKCVNAVTEDEMHQSVIYNLTHGIFISRPKAFVSDEQWEFVCELCAFDPLKRLGLCDAIDQLSRFAADELESHAETTV